MSDINARLGRLYSHQGRAGRLEFFAVWLAGLAALVLSVVPVFAAVGLAAAELAADGLADPDLIVMTMLESETLPVLLVLWSWFSSVLGWALFVMGIMTAARRLADIGASKWWVLLITVPLVNLVFLVFLLLKGPKADPAV